MIVLVIRAGLGLVTWICVSILTATSSGCSAVGANAPCHGSGLSLRFAEALEEVADTKSVAKAAALYVLEAAANARVVAARCGRSRCLSRLGYHELAARDFKMSLDSITLEDPAVSATRCDLALNRAIAVSAELPSAIQVVQHEMINVEKAISSRAREASLPAAWCVCHHIASTLERNGEWELAASWSASGIKYYSCQECLESHCHNLANLGLNARAEELLTLAINNDLVDTAVRSRLLRLRHRVRSERDPDSAQADLELAMKLELAHKQNTVEIASQVIGEAVHCAEASGRRLWAGLPIAGGIGAAGPSDTSGSNAARGDELAYLHSVIIVGLCNPARVVTLRVHHPSDYRWSIDTTDHCEAIVLCIIAGAPTIDREVVRALCALLHSALPYAHRLCREHERLVSDAVTAIGNPLASEMSQVESLVMERVGEASR
jgi:hypothetical protein